MLPTFVIAMAIARSIVMAFCYGFCLFPWLCFRRMLLLFRLLLDIGMAMAVAMAVGYCDSLWLLLWLCPWLLIQVFVIAIGSC